MSATFWLTRLAYSYFILLFSWALLHALFGDRWGWLFLVNSFALYWFLPLPAVIVIAVLIRQPLLLIGTGMVILLWAYFFGWMILPKQREPRDSGTQLTIMTFNLLGYNEHPQQAVAALRMAEADVICLQELNPPTARAIQQDLISKYPHQYLDPYHGDAGMGVISRYPLQALEVNLPGEWIGKPQVLRLDIAGVNTLLVNMHAMSPRFADMEWTVRERERQAAVLAAFAARQSEPLIVAGDFNAGDMSRAYSIVTQQMQDAWREGGLGPGNTFPGANSPGSSRRIIAGTPAPQWLVQIDYIFHSPHWDVAWTRIGPWDGVSDHRPVVARLALKRRT